MIEQLNNAILDLTHLIKSNPESAKSIDPAALAGLNHLTENAEHRQDCFSLVVNYKGLECASLLSESFLENVAPRDLLGIINAECLKLSINILRATEEMRPKQVIH